MKRIAWLGLLTALVCGPSVQALATTDLDVGNRTLKAENTYGTWVNPEDLTPMPQCIAQQDQTAWLSVMTECTHKICIRHFGVFCTRHQWLIQLTCLNDGFTHEVLEQYMPYCSRSVLMKAQLYLWIYKTTGRTWIADVGDSNDVQNLSPASLVRGYSNFDVIHKAPTCLTDSVSPLSMESFERALSSCSFASQTEHTGNAARPWEYREDLVSMVSLDFETIGYDLTGHYIFESRYFDNNCLCRTFNMDPDNEPCNEHKGLELTKERLWMYATCGSEYLPISWRNDLKILGFEYMPTREWQWPSCHKDMTKQVTKLPDQCATDVCEINSRGFCDVKRAIDRSCVCRDLNYDSCGGACHFFETRIEYVKWLHGLCGDVPDWHGLPDNWHQLASPTTGDMIPWHWNLKTTDTCTSGDWKLGSIILINIVSVIAAFLSRRTDVQNTLANFRWYPYAGGWIVTGISTAAFQLFANWLNATLVQSTPGYEDVSVFELMLLWCTIPRLAWVVMSLISVQPFDKTNFAAAKASLFAELILQGFSAYCMTMAVSYGIEHDFYSEGLRYAERRGSAKMMYMGALAWCIIMVLTLIHVLLALSRVYKLAESSDGNLPRHYRVKKSTSNIAEELLSQMDRGYTRLGEPLAEHWKDQHRASGGASSRSNGQGKYTVYGTVSVPAETEDDGKDELKDAVLKLYSVAVVITFFLWITQWIFWAGFIGLASEEYCPPSLGFLTAVWVVSHMQIPLLKLFNRKDA